MPSAPTMERVYTVDEVAKILKVDPRTVRRWIAQGKIRSFKVGHEHRIRQRALDEVMQDGGTSKKDEEQT